MGGKTGLYEVGVPIKENTKKGYKMAHPGDSIDLGYAGMNTRRGRVGYQIAHTLTTGNQQGTLHFVDLSPPPLVTEQCRCLNTRPSGIHNHKYVPHVLRYYSGGSLFAGLFGNEQLVTIARTQLGNEGGQKFWSWYGFSSREEWCACFVSWCADQSGLIANGSVPRFSLCDDGVIWFQSQGKWQGAGSIPASGSIIFFDWNGDGTSDHVGIVASCDGTTVHTIEGNSGDAVRERSYGIDNGTIIGYGFGGM